jgi:hypothetical protein
MRRSLLILGLAVLLAGCGDDESSDTLATNSTTSSTSTTASTTTAAPPTSAGESTTTASSTTTTAAEGGDATVTGKAVLARASGVTRLDITSCSSTGESSLNLSATDDDGDVLEIKARNDVGVATYRGPQESREGTTVRVTVGGDQGFNVVGGLNGEEFTLTGRCA